MAIHAARGEKLWEMHEILFNNRRHLGIISLRSYTKEIGIASKSFLNELINGKYGVCIQDDLKYGIELGVKEVPVFFINGKKPEGYVPEKSVSENIDEALPEVKV